MASLTLAQQEFFNANPIVVLSTANEENQPRSVYVEANKIQEDKIIITDNQMQVTKQNILRNPKVYILATDNNYNVLQIEGIATYYTDGEYFDYILSLPSNEGYTPKGVVVITIIDIKEVK